MNSKHMMMLACAAAFCGGVLAEETKNEGTANSEELSWAPGEGISFGEQAIMSTEVGLAFDSKFMSYGLVDNKDPIITPSAAVTFFDWVAFDCAALFDTTTYGRKAGYSNRGGRYIEFDSGVGLAHAFSPDDYGFLPTTVELSLGYAYEYHPRAMGGGTGEPGCLNSAAINLGVPGVLHGEYTMLLQNADGQIEPSSSISAGLDYPGVGPEHAYYAKSGRVKYGIAYDNEALTAFQALCRDEGILPALESSHALGYVLAHADEFEKGSRVIVNLSGRGDKDMDYVIEHYGIPD